MEWLREPVGTSQSADGGDRFCQWLCVNLCFLDCGLCLVYVYEM